MTKSFLLVAQEYKNEIKKLISGLPSYNQHRIITLFDNVVYEYKHSTDCGRAMDDWMNDSGIQYPSARVLANYIDLEAQKFENDYEFEGIGNDDD